MAGSPTERTLNELRKQGYSVAVVEKWNPHARVRIDLFGGIDLLAIRRRETLGVQATSGNNLKARVKKLTSLEGMKNWLEGGTRRLEVWGWTKYKKRGQKRARYRLRRTKLILQKGEIIPVRDALNSRHTSHSTP
jgi:hypothetical protein